MLIHKPSLLYTEVSSFQVWNRGTPLYIEVYSYQDIEVDGLTINRGVHFNG